MENKKPLNCHETPNRDSKVGWISVKDRLPSDFVSVLAHMTDAGEFPAVREAYTVCGRFFFPALKENHPVDYWAEMPEPPEEEGRSND